MVKRKAKRKNIFEPLKIMPLEPYGLIEDFEFTNADKIIVEYFLEYKNVPIHISGLSRAVTITGKSGEKKRSLTKKHTAERCQILEQKGILKHKSLKPPRGSGKRTPHYYLNDDIEAFQSIVNVYTKKESAFKTLLFMQSKYLEKAVNKNIDALLYRWLIPNDEDELETKIFLLYIDKLAKRLADQKSENSIDHEIKSINGNSKSTESITVEIIEELNNELKSITRKKAEEGFLNYFEKEGVFTKYQKDLYANVVMISPTALQSLVFLPFPTLLDQYKELELWDIIYLDELKIKRKGRQKLKWKQLNRVISQLLYHSMIVDIMRYPYLVMPQNKKVLLEKITSNIVESEN